MTEHGAEPDSTIDPLISVQGVSRTYEPLGPQRLRRFFSHLGGIDAADPMFGFAEVEEEEMFGDDDEEVIAPTGVGAAVTDVTFEAQPGECIAVAGPSGSGKSVLLKLLAGVLSPTAGRVLVYGKVAPALMEGASMIPKMHSLKAGLPVVAGMLGVSRRQVRLRLPQILGFADAAALAKVRGATLESRLRRELLLAMMLHVEASVVVVDVPLPRGEREERYRAKLLERKAEGALIVVATRDPNSLAGLADRVLTMRGGRLVADEPFGEALVNEAPREADGSGDPPAPQGRVVEARRRWDSPSHPRDLGPKRYAILGGGGAVAAHYVASLFELGHAERIIALGAGASGPDLSVLGCDDVGECYEYRTYGPGHRLEPLIELLDEEQPQLVVNCSDHGATAEATAPEEFLETDPIPLAQLVEELSMRDYFRRFIQIGTADVYGSVDQPVSESAPLRPADPITASIASFEVYLLNAHRGMGLPVNVIRATEVYGPGQSEDRLIAGAALAGVAGRPFALSRGLSDRRSFLHLRDLAAAIQKVAARAPLGRVYNVGYWDPNSVASEPIAVSTLLEHVATELGVPFEDLTIESSKEESVEQVQWVDSSSIKREAKWKPRVPVEDGIREMIGWARSHARTG